MKEVSKENPRQPFSIGRVCCYSAAPYRGLEEDAKGGVPKGECCSETVAFHRAIGACNAPVQTPEPLQRASADDGGIADDDRVGYRQEEETQWAEAGGQSGSLTVGLAAENQGLDSGSA